MEDHMTDQEWFDLFKKSLQLTQVNLDYSVYLMNRDNLLPAGKNIPDFFEFRQWVHDIRKTEEIEPSFSIESIYKLQSYIDDNSRILDVYAEVFDQGSVIRTLFRNAQRGLNRTWAILDVGQEHFAGRPTSIDIEQYLNSLESSFQSD